MPLDPELAPLCEQLNGLPAMSLSTPAAARERFQQMSVASQQLFPKIDVGAVEELFVPGAGGLMRSRLYRPQAEGPVPTLLFIHGGGFVIGDLESYDSQCRTLCRDAGVAVLAIEYRLAPDDPFPAAVDDVLVAAKWTLENVADLGGDPSRVAVGGDSAGGNLAAVVSQAMRDSEPGFCAQVLLYPVTDFASERPSHEENGEGLFLTLDDMRWFESNYLGEADPREDPRASPLFAEDLRGVPRAIVVTAGMDPLRDDGQAYADALEAAGVKVISRRYDTLVHGFFAMGHFSSTAQRAIDEICDDIRGVLE